MPYRYLIDSRGIHWRVWDVRPTLIDRRGAVRRLKALTIPHAERRMLPTRRLDVPRSRLYFPPSETGWLCFESEEERIRLKPIPEDWMVLEDHTLAELRHQGNSRNHKP
jgi:hypothetical protein